jgi:hypothetical protein
LAHGHGGACGTAIELERAAVSRQWLAWIYMQFFDHGNFSEHLSAALKWSTSLTLCALIAYGFAMRWTQKVSRIFGTLFGALLFISLIVGVADLIYFAHTFNSKIGASGGLFNSHWITWGAVSIGGIAAAVPSVLRFVPIFKSPAVRTAVLKVALYAAALVLPVLAIVVFHSLLSLSPSNTLAPDVSHFSWIEPHFSWTLYSPIIALIALISGFVAFFCLDINLTGPHRLYRNQLANTFIRRFPNSSAFIPLEAINPSSRAPYHLVNTAVNLPGSGSPALRDRQCDFFVFSKHWSGSPSTGYVETKEWRTGSAAVDLATVMAISGAAVAPNMGLGSYPTLRALLTFLNVRLGYWIRRPQKSTRFWNAAGFSCLLREMTGIGMSEKKRWLNLTDGGHIENVGVYELLRRRCKFILCVDGEQDASYHFQGLITVARHAQIDLGIRIAPDLDDLRPDPKTGLSRTHFAFCRIEYPENGAIGLMLYIKLSLTGNEDELIKRYNIMHAEFPHQSTLDQFFDQEQFEMYRRLGVHIAEVLFGLAITGGSNKPTSIAEWYRSLARNLLEPTQ